MDQTTPYVVYMTTSPATLAIDPACQADPFYRYKMRQLQVQVIGNGKMVRTSLTNLEDVSKDLNLPPEYVPNYLAKMIGAQAKYDKKKPERERGSISGEYPLQELSDLLVRCIREIVLCKKCRYPELNYTAVPKKDVRMTCRSCGWKGTLSSMKEINEKFRRFVINNPPPKSTIMVKKPKEVVTTLESTNGSAKDKAAKGKKDAAAEAKDDDWAIDTSAEAAKERMESLVPDRLKGLIASDKPEETSEQRLRGLVSKSPVASAEEINDEIMRAQKDNFLDEKSRTALVFDGLLSDAVLDIKKFVERVRGIKPSLQRFVTSNPANQRELLAALARFADKQMGSAKSTLNKLGSSLLKFLYDEEVLDEENILIWFGSITSSTAWTKAVEPFCKWLEEAEEDEDSEEGGDEDDEEEEEEEEPAKEEAAKVDDELDAEIDAL